MGKGTGARGNIQSSKNCESSFRRVERRVCWEMMGEVAGKVRKI